VELKRHVRGSACEAGALCPICEAGQAGNSVPSKARA
jgi:hypothetical protein